MPAPAKFSEQFYERFGHDFIEELADWLRRMDVTYRTQLRELNELNAARFEAHVSHELGEAKHELRQEIAEVRREISELLLEVRTETREGFANVKADAAALEARLTSRLLRWMFVFWTGTTITLLGAIFAISQL